MRALVIGAGGMFGGMVARELLRRGHVVRAVQRPGGSVVSIAGAEIVTASALDASALLAAAQGCDAIVFGFHIPYGTWEDGAVRAAEITAEVAAKVGATVLFPGNVYGLGPDFSMPLAEDAPRKAPTRMGEIRNEMEAALRAACERGARAIVLRAGDFIAPSASNSWLTMMTSRAIKGGAILAPAPDGVPHAWAYLLDVVAAGVDLLEKRQSFAPYEEFHFEGYTLTQEAMLEAVRHTLGDPTRKVRKMPWWLLRMIAPLSPMLRAVLDMSYLWRVPLRLDGSKLRRALPELRVTPLGQALQATLGQPAKCLRIEQARA